MKAVIKKVGEVTLSALLVGLICIPIPAVSALAEEADGDTIEQSEQTQPQSDETTDNVITSTNGTKTDAADDVQAAGNTQGAYASSDDVNTGVNVSETADPNNMTNAGEATEATENAGITTFAANRTEDGNAAESADSTEDSEGTEGTEGTEDTEEAVNAADTDTSTVSNAEELESAFSTVNAQSAAGPYTISLSGNIDLSSSLNVGSGKVVTIEGNGHRIVLEGTSTLGVNGTGASLTLNGALTIEAGATHKGSMITVQYGILNMNAGVTIEGNGDNSASMGGGVSVTNKGTFNMNGGTIENCAAAHGGGVYLDASTFNMSGDAIIQNCRAYGNGGMDNGDGAGVYMKSDRRVAYTQMTMSGNATIRDNSATSTGGGIYMDTITTLTMEGNASIVDNSADAAGGVMSYGMATLTAVYNNTSTNGAADIFSRGRAKLSPVSPDWVISKTGTHADGWYQDYYHATDASGSQGDGGHRWTPGADYNIEYVPSDGVTSEVLTLAAGAPLPESPHVNVVWENQDGTVLYEMDDVKIDEVPAADEYTELSGHDDPTESDTPDGYAHEFTGWLETHPSDDEVLYIANYKLVAPHDASAHTLTIHYVDESGNKLAPDYTEAVEEGDEYDIQSPYVDGYKADTDEVKGTVANDDIDKTVVYHVENSPATPATDNPTDPATSNDDSTNGGEMTEMTPDEAAAHYGTPGENARTDEYGALPQTGDDMDYVMTGLVALMGASAIAFGVAMAMRKREE